MPQPRALRCALDQAGNVRQDDVLAVAADNAQVGGQGGEVVVADLGLGAGDHREDGALAHTVDAAQHVYLAVKVPYHMFLPAPERVNLYLLDIVCEFLHRSFLLMSVLCQSQFLFQILILVQGALYIQPRLGIC